MYFTALGMPWYESKMAVGYAFHFSWYALDMSWYALGMVWYALKYYHLREIKQGKFACPYTIVMPKFSLTDV